MKNKRALALILTACLIFVMCSCSKNEPASAESSASSASAESASSVEPSEPAAPGEPEEISAEITMENFVNKLNAGNYVVDAEN